ncbi:hypothetical protein T09_4473, partial [Trichinella sp. T9]
LDSESQIRLMHRTHIRKMSIIASAQCDKLKELVVLPEIIEVLLNLKTERTALHTT